MRKLITIAALLAAVVMLTITVHAEAGADKPATDQTSQTEQSFEDTYDLRTVTGITAEQLAPYMHPETRHLAADVISICEREGVSAEFVAAVIRWERIPEIHNWFGWTSNAGGYMVFDTDIEGLEHCIRNIKIMYLTKRPVDAAEDDITGSCYNGYTVAAVSIMYNNTDYWREKIAGQAEKIVRSVQ